MYIHSLAWPNLSRDPLPLQPTFEVAQRCNGSRVKLR